MPARHKDTTFLFRINAQLLAEAQARAQAQGVSLSQVINAALVDYVRYGTTRPPPESQEEDDSPFF